MAYQKKIEEYKYNLSKVLNVPFEKIDERIDKFRKINWLKADEKGTKSEGYELLLKYPAETLILKEYKKNPKDIGKKKDAGFKDYIAEKAILKVALRYPELSEIFPTLISDDNPFFDSKHSLLVETVVSKTLEQLLQDNKSESNMKALITTMETFAKFFNRMPHYKHAVENEMQIISGGKINGIETKRFHDYASSFKKYYKIIFSKSDKKAVGAFGYAALHYFGEPRLILNDAYPSNLAPERFIDVGNPKNGPIAVQIACIFNPTVLDALKRENVKPENLIYSFCEKYGKEKNPENLIRGVLGASVYTNLRCAAGIKMRKRGKKAREFMHNYISAAREMAKLLASKDERTIPLYRAINPEAAKW